MNWSGYGKELKKVDTSGKCHTLLQDIFLFEIIVIPMHVI